MDALISNRRTLEITHRPAPTAAATGTGQCRSTTGELRMTPAIGRDTVASDTTTFVEWGRTGNFIVTFASTLGQTGQDLADAILTSCEQDYERLQGWFNGLTPGGLPFTIRIQAGSSGARHAGCKATELFLDDFSGTNADLVRMLLVAEADEVFMANQSASWDCGASNGEALSRILATEAYPAQLNGFATAASWLSSVRANFIDTTDPTDGNFVSTGCGTLFINYLRFQLDIGLRAIVHAGAPTLAESYAKLTGTTDAFAPFARLLNRFFPGTSSNVSGDNPFPLLFVDHFYTASALEKAAAIHPNTAKLYRMLNPNSGDHFYTLSGLEAELASVDDGYRFEGGAAYVFTAQSPNTVPLFRLFNRNSGDHFYTTSAAERTNAILNDGYGAEGIACYVFSSQQPDTTPLFRLFRAADGDHFYTASAVERDNAIRQFGYTDEGVACFVYGFSTYTDEGTACHVFPTQAPGTTPLYRLASTTTIDHFYTASSTERDSAVKNAGYVDEGVACYLFGSQMAGTEPLYRAFSPKSGDHFYTGSLAEKNNAVANLGYQDEGVVGYVFSTPASGTTPLYRMLRTAPATA